MVRICISTVYLHKVVRDTSYMHSSKGIFLSFWAWAVNVKDCITGGQSICGNWGPDHYRTEGVCCLQLIFLPLWLQAHIALLTSTTCKTSHTHTHQSPFLPFCKGNEKSVLNCLKTYFLFQLVKRELYCCTTIRVDFLRPGGLGLSSDTVKQKKWQSLMQHQQNSLLPEAEPSKGAGPSLSGCPPVDSRPGREHTVQLHSH